MTCKDCIHEQCYTEDLDDTEICNFFVDKNQYVEVRYGEWKFHEDGSGTCNRCGGTQRNVWDYDSWQNYCGRCGADMRYYPRNSERSLLFASLDEIIDAY